MGAFFDYPLSEEQMAAYLDGMLNAEQSNMVEELIASDPDMSGIQDAIDTVDASFIAFDTSEELPLECLADDFVLPEILMADDFAHHHDDDAVPDSNVVADDDNDDYQDNYNDHDHDSVLGYHDVDVADDMGGSVDYDDSYDEASF